MPQSNNGLGWFEEHNKEFEVLTWPQNSSDLNPIKHLWDVLDKQVCSMEATPRNLQVLKDLLVPDTTAHLQGSSGVHASMGQGCFGSNGGTNTI